MRHVFCALSGQAEDLDAEEKKALAEPTATKNPMAVAWGLTA
jgi:hypothetical protein